MTKQRSRKRGQHAYRFAFARVGLQLFSWIARTTLSWSTTQAAESASIQPASRSATTTLIDALLDNALLDRALLDRALLYCALLNGARPDGAGSDCARPNRALLYDALLNDALRYTLRDALSDASNRRRRNCR